MVAYFRHNNNHSESLIDREWREKLNQLKIFAGNAFFLTLLGIGLVHAEGVPQKLPERDAVLATLGSVADYYIKNHPTPGGGDWTNGVVYIGILDAYNATGKSAYSDYALNHAKKLNWKINGGISTAHADNFTVGQEYLGLSSNSSDLASVIQQTNALIDSNNYAAWTWVDAIHMQMNDFTELGNRMVNSTYDYHGWMDKMYNYTKTSLKLYDSTDHLWYRDTRYLYPDHQTANGKKIYWSRGNGWVYVSLARTLETLSPSSPLYASYKQTFLDMSSALVSRQRSDGFWNSNLDDPSDHGGPETTGTAAFAYGLAVGIRLNFLADPSYAQALVSAWSALSTMAVKASGAVGYCQPVGENPQAVTDTSTSNFCVGLVLRAASALSRIAPVTGTTSSPANYALNTPVTYSKQQSGNGAAHLVDGITVDSNRWSAQGYPQWTQIDLGSVKTITRTELSPYLARAYQYKVEGSVDGMTYTVLADRTSNIAGGTTLFDVFPAAQARYIKLTVTGATAYSNGGDWVSIQEFAVRP